MLFRSRRSASERPRWRPQISTLVTRRLRSHSQVEKILNNETMKPGDVIIALPSTGVHSNGFSLVRKIFDIDGDPAVLKTAPAELGGKTLGEALLAPTKIYVKPVLKVLEEVDVKGISHITGGGFYENIPRSLKKGCCARINKAQAHVTLAVTNDDESHEGHATAALRSEEHTSELQSH